jgi:hypothetical protein
MNNDTFSLARFVPLLAEKLEEQYHCRLSEDEFPYVKPPSYLTGSPLIRAPVSGDSRSSPHSPHSQSREVRSISSFRTKGAGKAEGSNVLNAPSASSALSLSTPAKTRAAQLGGSRTNTSRVFIFFVGGFTHSELRLAHHVSETFGKDVFIGGTSVLRPREFIESLKTLA